MVSIFLLLINLNFDSSTSRIPPFLKFILLIFIGIYPAYLFQFSPWGFVITNKFLRAQLFFSTLYVMTCLGYGKRINFSEIYKCFPFLFYLTIALVLSNNVKTISANPFSTSWSEGNRFWDYSLLLWRDRYQSINGTNLAAFLDLGRQVLWGSAFIFNNLTIMRLRIWDSLLYIIPPIILGLLLFRNKNFKIGNLFLYSLWTYLVISNGPIYAPIIICAILVILSAEISFLPISMLLVIASGFYANLSRFTWIIGPPIWAFLLFYFQDQKSSSLDRNQKGIIYLLSGILGGLILPHFLQIHTNSIIQELNKPADIYHSVIDILGNQQLLWDRLLPSKTLDSGILPSVFLVVSPLIILVLLYIYQKNIKFIKSEIFYLVSSLVITFLIGIIVSVKIGGGSNLHNMDLFIITVLIVISIFWKNGASDWFSKNFRQNNLISYLTLFTILLTGIRFIFSAKPVLTPSNHEIEYALSSIQTTIDNRKNDGEILFIDQRQLVTFDEISGVKIVEEYEKKLMMNEALSNNQSYFDNFYNDLENHRFALIINEPIRIVYQGQKIKFGEENDAYVKWVSEPLFCYYEPLETFSSVGTELLIPRVNPAPDYLNCPQENK